MNARVLIPVYRLPLSENEAVSLRQVCTVLRDWPLVIVKPEKLDVSPLSALYPFLQVESFDDAYFEGIAGYNRLMLSTEFYARFLESEYILIYQLDAWVFRDELRSWCEKGYDYIGAPWLENPVNRYPLMASWTRMRHRHLLQSGRNSRQSLYDKIGNGGFSLRRVESLYRATIGHADRIAYYLSQKQSHFYHEDVFWATEIPTFSYPDPMDALRFSFDTHPRYCFRLTNGHLPFGCHGWDKRKMKGFWKSRIPIDNKNS
jgi:hypothetical protein